MLFMARPDLQSVHTLADTLESVEVTADELMDRKLPGTRGTPPTEITETTIQDRLAAQRAFVTDVRRLELTLVTKLEQARVRAGVLARSDWRLRPIMTMFTAGTQSLADHITSPEGRAAMRFDGGMEPFAFLKNRALLPEGAGDFDGADQIRVTETFRVLGLATLGEVMQRCEATLNALDAQYDLYEWDEAEQAKAPPQPVVTEVPAPVVAEAAAVGTATNWGEPAAATAEPSPDEIAKANAESEEALKSLSERLAELKAPAADAELAPVPAETTAA